jgi:muconate cycloisomerase
MIAEAAGLTCTVGSNLELGVASAAMAHLAMASPGIGAEEFPCDILGPVSYLDDVVEEPIEYARGRVRASDRPGLGVALDDAKLKKYAL